jgi:hypothetical protein
MEEDTSVDDVMSEEMLQKLRNWQQEQKSRLMEQQQHQRLLLMEKQKKLLSMINTGDKLNAPESGSVGIVEPSDLISAAEFDNQNENRDHSQKISLNSPHSVDDVLLKKPRSVQTFQQLLETSMNTKDQALTSQNTAQVKKFTFLKRGQGISRFGVISKPKIGKPTQSKENLGKENKIPPITKSAKIQVNKKLPSPLVQSQLSSKPTAVESVQDSQISTQDLPFTPQRVDESLRDINSSRNEEDLAVFELLERFANINASFSSSSSLIGQLIDKGVTHLPSPSKVINFLSRKQTNISASNSDVGVASERKSGKPSRHVRFAENIEEEQTQSKFNEEEYEKPWLVDISEEDPGHSHASPYVSNTIRPSQNSNEPTSPVRERFDLDETPTSPIGFPDYHKLFGNPVRSLWTNEELSSPTTQDESFLKNSNPLSNFSDPVIDQIKGDLKCVYIGNSGEE